MSGRLTLSVGQSARRFFARPSTITLSQPSASLLSHQSRSLTTSSSSLLFAAPAAASPNKPSKAAVLEAINKKQGAAQAEVLAEYHAVRRRNAVWGLILGAFVTGVWWYSVQAVTSAKESLTSPETQQLLAEIAREEKAKDAKKL